MLLFDDLVGETRLLKGFFLKLLSVRNDIVVDFGDNPRYLSTTSASVIFEDRVDKRDFK